MSLVQFYFTGTRSFEEGYDGVFMEMSDISAGDGFANFVPEIGPILVDGWNALDSKG